MSVKTCPHCGSIIKEPVTKTTKRNRYFIYASGKRVAENIRLQNKQDWEKVVRALNLSMETVDAPYEDIVVMNDKSRVIFEQRKSYD